MNTTVDSTENCPQPFALNVYQSPAKLDFSGVYAREIADSDEEELDVSPADLGLDFV